MASWLEGGPTGDGSATGLPAEGRGSQAWLGRRLVALAVDWALASAVGWGFFAGDPMAILAVFGLSTLVLVGTLGHTVGHRVLGLHVARRVELVPQDEARTAQERETLRLRRERALSFGPGPLPALVRTVLLCLVIPAVVWGADGRGMHDVAAGTVLVRR